MPYGMASTLTLTWLNEVSSLPRVGYICGESIDSVHPGATHRVAFWDS